MFLKDLKITINSQISVHDVFAANLKLEYYKKVEILTNLIEKMFIFNENEEYILRIENKAISMTDHIRIKNHEHSKNNRSEQEVVKRAEETKEISRRRERFFTMVNLSDELKEEAIKVEKYYVLNNQLCKISAYFIDEPENENLKPHNPKQLKSMMSNKTSMNKRLNGTVSHIGTVAAQEISSVYFETEFVLKDKWKDVLKKVLLYDDLRDYLYGNLTDSDLIYSQNKREQILDVIWDNIVLRHNKLIMTNDIKIVHHKDWEFPETEFTTKLSKAKFLEGINLQGAGGTVYNKNQIGKTTINNSI